MSDAQAKKKVEVKKLNFDNITSPTIPEVEKTEIIDSKVQEGCWIFGKSITEVTNDEFKEWIAEKLPSVTSWEESEINTPKKKEKIIIKIFDEISKNVECLKQIYKFSILLKLL